MSASITAPVQVTGPATATATTPSIIDAANLEAQQDEMTALSSILDPTTFIVHEPSYAGGLLSGCMVINVSVPPNGIKLTSTNFGRTRTNSVNSGSSVPTPVPAGPTSTSTLTLTPSIHTNYLPPLTLHYTLPAGYPNQEKPTFTLSACWLDRKRLSALCRKLDLLWEENKELNAILFVWYSFLKEDIFEFDELGLVPEYDISWWYQGPHGHGRERHRSGASASATIKEKAAVTVIEETVSAEATTDPNTKTEAIPITLTIPKTQSQNKPKEKEMLDPRAVVDWLPIASLMTHLASYNTEAIEQEFTQYSHPCQICFSDVSGTDCVKFPGCGHIFCRPCVRSFYVGLITDGAVDGVKCPGYQCKSAPNPNQVLAVVGAELFERYDRLLLQRTLDSMEDVLYCPRVKCHAHVLYDPADKMATCSSCRYVFCSICKMVYHGVEPCRFKSDEKARVFEKYTTGDADARKELEKTYGKKQLSILVQTMQSEQWVSQKSKPCPHCQVPIEKFEGCNKVTCFKCNTYFCWKCSAQLDAKNPYFHFNDPNSACFNTLFEGVVLFGDGGDGEDSDDEDEDEDDWLEFEDDYEEDEV